MLKMRKILLTSLVAMFAVGVGAASAAVAPQVTSKEYVDSGLVTKANKSDVATSLLAKQNNLGNGTANQVVVAGTTAGTVSYRGIDTVVTASSDNLITSGAVKTAIAEVVSGEMGGLGALAYEDIVSSSLLGSNAVATGKIADEAVTAAKIANGTITTTQLTGSIVTSLGLADTALQSGDNVSELVNDAGYLIETDLGSAAFADTTDFDAAGSAASVNTAFETFRDRSAGFATSAQGSNADTAKGVTDNVTSNSTIAKANSALQAGADISELTNDAGYLTEADMTGYATETYVTDRTGNVSALATTATDLTGAVNEVRTTANTAKSVTDSITTNDTIAKANSALQSAAITDMEVTTNKLKSVTGGGAGITGSATDTQYASAKAVYDAIAASAYNDATLAGQVADLETAVGDMELDTTATDITGAINELVTDISGKADKATTLAGYGITDAMAKVTCADGQMLMANASGGFDCIDVATTYTGDGD
ncbi:MAG: hypothetical protein FWF97_04475 [Alphaproteobacteria bacterium]|nr:hypothetical protein [Alphaproteobacteria bacterium]